MTVGWVYDCWVVAVRWVVWQVGGMTVGWVVWQLGGWYNCWVGLWQLGEWYNSWVGGTTVGLAVWLLGEWYDSWVGNTTFGWVIQQLGGWYDSLVGNTKVVWVVWQLGGWYSYTALCHAAFHAGKNPNFLWEKSPTEQRNDPFSLMTGLANLWLVEGHDGHVSWRGFTLVQRDAFLCASRAVVTAVQLQVKGQAGDTHDTTHKPVSSGILTSHQPHEISSGWTTGIQFLYQFKTQVTKSQGKS